MSESENKALDYDVIVKECSRKDKAVATLMAKQNADQERVQELYKEYEEAKKRFIVSSREHRNYLARKDTSRTILQREKAMLDAEMENVIDEKRKLEEKIVAESYQFRKNLDVHLNRFQELQFEFNNDKLCEEIRKSDEVIDDLKKQLAEAECQLKESAAFKINEEYQKVPHAAEVAEAVAQESFKLFGDPQVAKARFAELEKNILFFKKNLE